MLPKLMLVRQHYPAGEPLGDVNAAVSNTIQEKGVLPTELHGKRVGIAVGSRGINRLPEIVLAVVNQVKRMNGIPEIFAAMGCHGNATAQGQKEMLESLGITEQSMNTKIRCSAQVVYLGETVSGFPVYGNELALEYDAIVLINRVRPHTDFSGETESGVIKMLAIGIGNPEGSNNVHILSFNHGYVKVLQETAALMCQKLPVLFGLMITENWKSQLEYVEAVRPADFVKREMALLDRVKREMIRLPTEKLDLLLLGHMGKDVLGTGMDTKIIGRIMVRSEPEPTTPDIGRIVVLDLSEASHGNACGIGLTDIIPRRVFNKINLDATALNAISSMTPEQGRLPCVVADDRAAIVGALTSLGRHKEEIADMHIVYVRNTNYLDIMVVSEGLYLDAMEGNPRFEVLAPAQEMRFDEQGSLLNFKRELGL